MKAPTKHLFFMVKSCRDNCRLPWADSNAKIQFVIAHEIFTLDELVQYKIPVDWCIPVMIAKDGFYYSFGVRFISDKKR